MTCLCRLTRALLETCDRARGSKKRLVEVADEREPIAVQEDGDEQTAQQLARRLPQLLGQAGALLRRRSEQRRATHRRRPGSVPFAERGLERVAKLLAPERLGLEEGELPAV